MATLTDLIIEDDRASRSWFHETPVEQPSAVAHNQSPASDFSVSHTLVESQPTLRVDAGDTHDYLCNSANSSITVLEGTNLNAFNKSEIDETPAIRLNYEEGTTAQPGSSNFMMSLPVPRFDAKIGREVVIPTSKVVRASSGTYALPVCDEAVSPIKTWYAKWFNDWWALEAGSMCLATLCLVVITIMLLQFDGREMPRWKVSITIEAILSVLSGFTKSCLLMPTAEALGQIKWNTSKTEKRAIDVERIDKASRGTWGAVALIVRHRGITLASLGAAIILLSLPMDLCFQQIVNYPVESILDTSVIATISRAIVYDPPEDRQWRGDEYTVSEDQGISTFLYTSWSTNHTSGPGIEFSCPSGNCTYDPFHTLAVDFECKDLPSSLLVHTCAETSAEWLSWVAQGIDEPSNVTSCGFYLDLPGNGLQLMSGYELFTDGSEGERLATRVFPLSDLWTNQQYHEGGSIAFKQTKSRFMDFILVSTPGGFDGVRTNNTPVITECELHWTIKHITATVQNGVLSEHTLDTIPFDNDPEQTWDLEDSNWFKLQPSMTLPNPLSSTGSSTYEVDNTTARKVWQSWAQFAPSTFIRTNSSSPVGPYVMKVVWLGAQPGAPHLAQVLTPTLPWDTPNNVSAHMAQAVSTMNQVIRNNALSTRLQRDAAIGQVWRNAVMVRVNWRWFSFPAVLFCLAATFLILTIWRSSRDKKTTSVYKTSLLPMLLSSKENNATEFSTSRKMGTMRRQAKVSTMEVELTPH